MYRKLSAPVSCQIEITTGCDNNCIHCYNYWRHEQEIKGSNMSKAVLKKVTADIIESKVFHVTFTGGEPLMRKEILFEGIEILMNAGVVCDVNTNLTLITPESAGRLVSLGIGGVLTSVAAPVAILHDHIMQKKGAFNATLKGIKVSQDAGLVVAASMVVTKLNVKEVYSTGMFLHSIGVNQFYATKASPPLNSQNFMQYMLSDDELISLLEQLRRLREEIRMNVGALECYPLCSYVNQEAYSFMADRRCSAGVTTCSIGADGSVRACSHDDVSYGNVVTDGLISAWNSMSEWRDGTLLPEGCKQCKSFASCSGGCRVDAMYVSGCKSNQDPYTKYANVEKIVARKPRNHTDFTDKGSVFKISKELKYRDEGFCVLCAGQRNIASPATLSRGSYELIQGLNRRSATFGLNEVVCYTKLPPQSANELCNAFLNDGIFELT
ncbi:MAG: hypothetical protein A2481_01205 [Candidatus Yonathbacteria bacterium RIFOXYC2_FULL_47_9]|nr:MAG: hypothetical protein A2481_01205 [Candidatus Yonathbacteria bacterium RIFOXYC2_FULL_47_9]HAT68061.1 hypothetical protein [Candidatus Yonathbacteria bacterium]